MNDDRPKSKRSSLFRFSLKAFLSTILVVALFLGFFGHLFREARRRAIDANCSNNFRLIGLALHNYHDVYQRFPYGAILDDNAKPIHSWRIQLLHLTQSTPLAPQYDFGEPWDGPCNTRLGTGAPFLWTDKLGAKHICSVATPPFFCCSLDGDPSTMFTNCVAITGPGTCFPDGETRAFHNILDGSSNTIVFAEISNSDIHWLEPRDLRIDKMSFKINDSKKPSISSKHPTGPAVVFADAAVYRIDPSMPPETLKALLTIAGHERVTSDELIQQGLLH